MSEDVGEAVNTALENALVTIDQATVVLHFCHNAASRAERVKFGRQALQYFVIAQAQLEGLETELRATTSWHVWYDETRKGIASVRKLLDME